MNKIEQAIYPRIFIGWTVLGAILMYLFSADEVITRTGFSIQGLSFIWYGICFFICLWVRKLVDAIYTELRAGIAWEVRVALAEHFEEDRFG